LAVMIIVNRAPLAGKTIHNNIHTQGWSTWRVGARSVAALDIYLD
jgi:hypothetical protein